ncbi:GGDEF domain-containing protein [Mycobacterium vicinigordonae]|uniref:GGDEF domain-containing protein n=1 Tax=Mycobacterium vicinigordonae TaxID=1719132 RepID=UPI001FEAE06E|nr:GGDEF domain-containing protein [Mycobacterium vicinigordonae]
MTPSDQFDWISAYLKARDLQVIWRGAIFGVTAVQAALPLVLLSSPFGPDHALTRAVAVAASAAGASAAILWLVCWPTRQQSIAFSITSSMAIAALLLSMSNPYSGLVGCTTFAALGGFLGYFHAPRYVVANFAVATVCTAILAYRLLVSSGDAALVISSVITVASLNVGVPFGIQYLVHSLRTDLRTSDRDSLTGLHNRRSFYDSVCQLIALAQRRTGMHLTVAVIDLDNFKHLNDTRGHAVGDEALVAVAAAFEQVCRPTAVIARVGGEEFVIADADTMSNPTERAERLRLAVAALPFGITASIGTTGVPLGGRRVLRDIELIDDLIRTSDTAMYEAKRAGGNGVRHHPAPEPPLLT